MSNKFTLTCPDPPVPLPPGGYTTLPQYLLPKAGEFAAEGKSYWAIDATSKEKRYFHKFDIETRKIASALYKTGLRKNGIVIYMPADMIKLHIFLVGVWRANGICRASYPDDDPPTLEFRIKESNCKHILCDPNRVEVCKEAIKHVGWPVTILTTSGVGQGSECLSLDEILENDDGAGCPELQICGSDSALMLSTSGTTGQPKAACWRHSALLEDVHIKTYYPYSDDKPNLMFSTGTHYSGTTYTFALLASGRTSILTGKITKELLRKSVAEMKPGFVFAFPTYLLSLVSPDASEYDFSSVEVLLTGGGYLTPVIKKTLLQLPNCKDIINGYGLTECGISVANLSLVSNRKTPTDRSMPVEAVGRPYSGTSVQIRNPTTLEPLGPNEKGELCVYNTTSIHSYYKNPEAFKSAFADKFFRTGDIAYYDEQGYIYVCDRLKEVFKYYNNHISPVELENVIAQHPLVDEVCVVGVPDPGGDIPRAFVTLKGQCNNGTPETGEEIKEFANSKLADYKHLRGGLYVLPELPKGKTGKVTRSLVAQIKV